jgi:hypothetical protein
MVVSGAWRKLVHEKNLKSKILRHCPFKGERNHRVKKIEITLSFRRTTNWWNIVTSSVSGMVWQYFSSIQWGGEGESFPFYYELVGFGLACAPVRCSHPSYWAY